MSSRRSIGSERGLQLLSIGLAIFHLRLLVLGLTAKFDSISWPDGGGIRGLSPLIMLRENLYRIQQEERLPELPRPCDVFDLAGGTSTGGYVVTVTTVCPQALDIVF